MDRVSRRSFMEKAGIAFGSLSQASSGKAGLPSGEAAKGSEGKDVVRYGVERFVVEWAYSSGKAYSDPFNDLELDVVFTDPHGNEQRVPAFWAGEQVWRIRYSPATTGRYTYRTISSDTTNADLRIQYLVERGLVPCIVACWGYFLPLMGIKKMKTHWRNLIARWGAYPVVWCLAGEGAMPFYLSKTKTEDAATQRRGWTEVGRYVRSVDPYHHPHNDPSHRQRPKPSRGCVRPGFRHVANGPQRPEEHSQYGEPSYRIAAQKPSHAGPGGGSLLRGNPGGQPARSRTLHDAAGTWQAPITPTFADWIMVMEKKA